MSKLSSKQRLQLDGLAADIRRHPQMSVDTMAATVRTICEPPMGRPPSTSPRAVRRRYLLHQRKDVARQV